jgi:hypothetical protein
MVIWLTLGVAIFGLLALTLVLLSVLVRLGRLGRAAARVQHELAGADTLQTSLAHLQEQLGSLQEHADAVRTEALARRDRDTG